MSFYIPKFGFDSDTGEVKVPDILGLPEPRWELKDDSDLSLKNNDLYINLSKRTLEIDSSLIKAKEELGKAKEDLSEFKIGIEKEIGKIYYLAMAIIVAFFLAAIPIFLDYYKNNEERYEKFIDRTDSFYTKDDINRLLNLYDQNSHNKSDLDILINETQRNQEILQCLKFAGKFSINCFGG